MESDESAAGSRKSSFSLESPNAEDAAPLDEDKVSSVLLNFVEDSPFFRRDLSRQVRSETVDDNPHDLLAATWSVQQRCFTCSTFVVCRSCGQRTLTQNLATFANVFSNSLQLETSSQRYATLVSELFLSF